MLVFHVGTMKSGTTFLQSMLRKNHSRLLEQGWVYPGASLNHQHAVYDLAPNSVPWSVPLELKKNGKLAKGLEKQVSLHSKSNVILSAEVLSCLDKDGIAKVVKTFGKPDKVIFTVRSLSKVIPSAWQQYIKGGGKLSLEKFVNQMRKQRTSLQGIWKTYAYGHMINNWSQVAPVTTIVVPSKDKKSNLADLFCESIGLRSESLDCRIEKSNSNLSLGYELSEILRSLNLNHKLSANDRNYLLKQVIFPNIEKIKCSRISLNSSQSALANEWSKEENSMLQQFSHLIMGDLEDLTNQEDQLEDYSSNKLATGVASQLIHSLLVNRV